MKIWRARSLKGVVLALLCGGVGLGALAEAPYRVVLDETFSGDSPGNAPSAAARIISGEGYRVLVVDEATQPPDPFAPYGAPGNRSLLLENTRRDSTSGIWFDFPRKVSRGVLRLDFFFYRGHEDGVMLANGRLQLSLVGIPLSIHTAGSIRGRDGEEMVLLDQAVTVHEPNYLVVAFDAGEKEWQGWLNGEPLTAGGGERSRFVLPGGEDAAVSGVYLRPGSTKSTGVRVFIDRLMLTTGALPEAPRPGGRNMLPNADFSQTRGPREIYPAIGEYYSRDDFGWSLDREVFFTGGQSLRMAAGSTPFYWQVLDNELRAHEYYTESVFSVYLKGQHAGQQVEIGYEMAGLGDGANQTVRCASPRTVVLDDTWQRFELPLGARASWATNTPPPHSVRLHRAWVRPLQDGTLWVDAAQLENDRLEASQFIAERMNNDLPHGRVFRLGTHVWVDPEGPRDPLPAAAVTGPRGGTVSLNLLETCGFERRAEPIRGGIPFPEAELFDARRVRLLDATGREVPAQFIPLAYWGRDGSIRSLAIDFQVDLRAGETAAFELEYGETPAAEALAPLAKDTGKSIVIDTGVLRAVIRKDAFRWFDELTSGGEQRDPPAGAGSRIIGVDGVTYSSCAAAPDEVVIEDNGPLRATVRVSGRHADPTGARTRLHYEARIHAFAGKRHLVLEYTVENAEPFLHTAVKEIAMRLPHGGASGGRLGFADGTTHLFAAPFLSVQRQQHDGPGLYNCVLEDQDGTRMLDQARLAGWIETGGAALAVHDGWQLHPFAFAVSDALEFFHWPRKHVRAVDLPYGVSMHARLVYAPFGAHGAQGADGASYLVGRPPRDPTDPTAVQEDTLGTEQPLLHVDPEWVAASGVFGSFLSSAQAASIDPGFEARLQDYFALVSRDQDILGLTGKWNYGCNGTPKRWGNNEHTVCRNFWLQWLRSGDPRIWRRAWISTRHIREIDLCFGGPGARAQHYHFSGTHHVPHFGLGHYWITGLVWHYLLTGDRRSHDVARDAGAQGIMDSAIQQDGRGRARLLYVMAELYELTRLRVFREAFERQFAFDASVPLSDYHGGKNLLLLAKWYEATGNQEMRERLRAGAEALVAWRSQRPRPPYGSPSRGPCTLASGLAEAARITGNACYVSSASLIEMFSWWAMNLRFDVNAVRISEYLGQAHRLGANATLDLPPRVWGLASATGQGRSFHFLVQPEPDNPVTFQVHRTTGHEGHAVRVEVASEQQADVVSHDLVDEASHYKLQFSLERDGPGPFNVRVQSRSRDEFEISSSGGRVLLNADEFISLRHGSDLSSSFRFFLRSPRAGASIAIAIQWRGRDEGAAVGALLETLDYEPLAHARWVVPIGTFDGKQVKALDGRIERLVLPIPSSWRGETLMLTVVAPTRRLRWRVEGLEYPWLAIDPDDLAEDVSTGG